MESIKDEFDLKLKFMKPVTLNKKTPGEIRKSLPRPTNWTARLTNLLLILLVVGMVIVLVPDLKAWWDVTYDKAVIKYWKK